ncbi:MAG: hypothetical protein HYW48_05265 [Deltaproteobacteria bacterium]|nr:hypothetical protein [Deltaproteobacteria bacterium]
MPRLIASILFLLFFSSRASAVFMSEKAVRSGRLYLNTEYIQGPTLEREKRYGLILGLTGHPSFDWGGYEDQVGYCLLTDLVPDVKRRSGEVNVNQDFYSFSALITFSYVYWFRYSLLLGPGLLLSYTRYSILGDVDVRSEYSLLSSVGFVLDYAIDEVWEVSWMIRMQYRLAYEKWDWQYGFGAA